ncbi:MAG: hypothetical protein ACRDNW_13505 [Trebonia sp.]
MGVQDRQPCRAEQLLARFGAAAEPGQDGAQPFPVAQVAAGWVGGEGPGGGTPPAVAEQLALRLGGQRGTVDDDTGGDLKRFEVGGAAGSFPGRGQLADAGRAGARPGIGDGRPRVMRG